MSIVNINNILTEDSAIQTKPPKRKFIPKFNDNFWKWFKKSKVVDSKGNPLIVYHGSTSEFDAFDLSKANKGGFFGGNLYFSNSLQDVNKNYASYKGADLQNRIEDKAQELEQEDEIPVEDFEYYKNKAKELLAPNKGNIIPVFLSIQNPVYFANNKKKETFFDYRATYDEDTEEFTGDEEGLLVEFLMQLQGYLTENSYQRFMEEISDTFDNGGISASDLLTYLKDGDIYTEDDGPIVEVFIEIIKSLGFDGIIDSTVHKRFPNMRGMGPRSTHYIVFRPNQVKSIYNQGDWYEYSFGLKENQS